MFLADYHTHTRYSHGIGSVMDNAMVAKEKNLREIAVTDHGFSHITYGIRRKDLDNLRRDCIEASEVSGVKVLMGIEANINSLGTDLKPDDFRAFDIILAGYHKFAMPGRFSDFFNFTIPSALDTILKVKPSDRVDKLMTRAVVKAITTTPIDILTHISYGIHVDVGEVAKACRDYGTCIELNGKRICLNRDEFETILSSGVRLVVNSDAHSPDKVGDFSRGEEYLSQYSSEIMERVVNYEGVATDLRWYGRRDI